MYIYDNLNCYSYDSMMMMIINSVGVFINVLQNSIYKLT